jgi:hypothetical protein
MQLDASYEILRNVRRVRFAATLGTCGRGPGSEIGCGFNPLPKLGFRDPFSPGFS